MTTILNFTLDSGILLWGGFVAVSGAITWSVIRQVYLSPSNQTLDSPSTDSGVDTVINRSYETSPTIIKSRERLVEAINRELESNYGSSSSTLTPRSYNLNHGDLSTIQSNIESAHRLVSSDQEIITNLSTRIEKLESLSQMFTQQVDTGSLHFANFVADQTANQIIHYCHMLLLFYKVRSRLIFYLYYRLIFFYYQ